MRQRMLMRSLGIMAIIHIDKKIHILFQEDKKMSRTAERIKLNISAEEARVRIENFMKNAGYQQVEHKGKIIWHKDTFPTITPLLDFVTSRSHGWDFSFIGNEVIVEDFLWSFNHEWAAKGNLFATIFMCSLIPTLLGRAQHGTVIKFIQSL